MLWGYAMPGPGEENWKTLWCKKGDVAQNTPTTISAKEEESSLPSLDSKAISENRQNAQTNSPQEITEVCGRKDAVVEDLAEKDLEKSSQSEVQDGPAINASIQPAKAQLYSELSIVLTIISIIVAFAISIIEFMGIAVEKCASCAEAAENSSGLDGRWWRFWQACNDSSGYIGAGIVGVMLLCGGVYIGLRKYRRRQLARLEGSTKEEESKPAS